MTRFSAMLCAGLMLAAPALAATTPAAPAAAKAPAAKAPAAKAAPAKAAAKAAPIAKGDLKSGGAVWHITDADSLNQALVVDLVTPPAKKPVGEMDVVAAARLYLKGQKAMKGCAAASDPQPIAWSDSSVWVVSVGCK